MLGYGSKRKAVSKIVTAFTLVFYSCSSPFYLLAADPLLDPVSIATTDSFTSTSESSSTRTETSTDFLLSSALSAPTASPRVIVLRDVGGTSSWYEVRDGGRWTPYGNQSRTLEADVANAGDYTFRIWAKNYFNPGWKKPAGFTHFELSVKVDGIDAGILSIQADDARFRFGELTITNLSAGTHTLEVRWVNASGYDAAAKEDANLFLNTMVLEEIANPVTSGAEQVLESKRWNHGPADNSRWTSFGGESMTVEIVSQGGDVSVHVEAMNRNAPGWSKGSAYTHYEFEVRMDGLYKGLLRVNADDNGWQDGSLVITDLAAGRHVVRLLWLNGGKYDIETKTDPNVWIRSVTVNHVPAVSAITHNATDVDDTLAGLQVDEDTVIIFSASAADLDSADILSWEWFYTVDGGPETLFASGTGTIQDAVFDSAGLPGVYEWILRVSDGKESLENRLPIEVVAKPAVEPATFIITFPAEDQLLVGTTIDIRYALGGDQGEVDRIYLQLDGQPQVEDLDKNGIYSFTGVSEGAHILQGYLARADGTKILGTDFAVNFSTVISDADGPVVSALTAENITTTSAEITWTTDETADHFVEYRVVGSSAAEFATAAGTGMIHSVALTGLLPDTTYEYRVIASDDQGNATFTSYQNFTTLAVDVV